MKNSLSEEARGNAGLEAKEKIITNPSESINHVLKEAVEYEEMTLPEFTALAKAIGEHQEQLRTVIRKGKYRFKEGFAFLEIAASKWMHEMNQDQQQYHLHLVMQTHLDAARGPHQATSLTTSVLPVPIHRHS